jgi:hypothetical protein
MKLKSEVILSVLYASCLDTAVDIPGSAPEKRRESPEPDLNYASEARTFLYRSFS